MLHPSMRAPSRRRKISPENCSWSCTPGKWPIYRCPDGNKRAIQGTSWV